MTFSCSRWMLVFQLLLLIACLCVPQCQAFPLPPRHAVPSTALSMTEDKHVSRYEDSGAAEKGLVAYLTSLVNSLASKQPPPPARPWRLPPQSPQELLERIRAEYVEENYLWTGNIDLASFDEHCRYTDPTLSFVGRDTFVKNIANLRPIIDALVGECRSDLLDLQLDPHAGYIQSRWNMIGTLERLPWKPRIDVIGRTRFWYRQQDGNYGYQVIEYDEEWEIPAWKALLQLVTPAGTIANTTSRAD